LTLPDSINDKKFLPEMTFKHLRLYQTSSLTIESKTFIYGKIEGKKYKQMLENKASVIKSIN